MDQAELKRRVVENIPGGGPRQFIVPLAFIAEAVIGGVISYGVQQCMGWLWPKYTANPGPILRTRLRWAIRSQCRAAADLPQAKQLGLSGHDIERQLGGPIEEAFLATGRQLDATDVVAFRAACGAPPR